MRILLLCVLLGSNCFGQKEFEIKDKTYSLGLFAQASFDYNPVGLEVGIQYQKHWLNIALGYLPTRFSENYTLGVDYNYFPNTYKNRFNLFFDANILFVSGFTRWSMDESISAVGGFGFNTNFSKHLFFKTSVLGGWTYEIDDTMPYRTFQFRIGFGYRF